MIGRDDRVRIRTRRESIIAAFSRATPKTDESLYRCPLVTRHDEYHNKFGRDSDLEVFGHHIYVCGNRVRDTHYITNAITIF